MRKRKIIAVVLAMALVVTSIVGYYFIIANSLSGYTKISLMSTQTYSIKFGESSTVYYITYFYNYSQNGIASTKPIFQVTAQTLINNSSQGFEARQGLRCSFSGLQMVADNANSNQMVLYVKSTVSNSKPIIFPIPTSSG